MLHFNRLNGKFLLIIVTILSSCLYSYSESKEQLFTFLKSLKTGVNDVSGEVIMNDYLTGNEDNWITSIECDTIYTNTSLRGIILYAKPSNNAYSDIIINFDKSKLMKVSNLYFYINKLDQKDPKVEVYLNGKKVTMNTMYFDSTKAKADQYTEVELSPQGLAKVSNVWASSNNSIANIPMKTLEIRNYDDATSTTRLQLIGFRVKYDGTENEDISTDVENLVFYKESTIGYYDLMGRKLSAEPSTGLFIVRENGKTRKVLKP